MSHPEIVAFLEKQCAEILGDDDEMTQFHIALASAGVHYGRIEYLTSTKVYVSFTLAEVTLEQYAFAQKVPLGISSYIELHAEKEVKMLTWSYTPQILPKDSFSAEEVLDEIFREARHEMGKILVALCGPSFTASPRMSVEEQICCLNSVESGPYPN